MLAGSKLVGLLRSATVGTMPYLRKYSFEKRIELMPVYRPQWRGVLGGAVEFVGVGHCPISTQ